MASTWSWLLEEERNFATMAIKSPECVWLPRALNEKNKDTGLAALINPVGNSSYNEYRNEYPKVNNGSTGGTLTGVL